MSSNSKSKLTAIATMVILALLAVNGYLLFNKFNADEKISQLDKDLIETEKLKADLEKQYYDALSELEDQKGKSAALDQRIAEQEGELKKQKNRIGALISKERNTREDLENARLQINSLITQQDNFIAEIGALKRDKEQLTVRNTQLSEEQKILREEVKTERVSNQGLLAEKAVLVSEKSELEDVREQLTAKVNLGSIISVGSVDVTGWKLKKSGKAVERNAAKSIDRLKICYAINNNAVVEAGDETFYVRLINPRGETMAVESLGSGVMNNKATGEEVRYTKSKDVEYNNVSMNSCMHWEPGTAFEKGNYKVQVYNKGYLSGAGEFTLK